MKGGFMILTGEPGFRVSLVIKDLAVELSPSEAIRVGEDLARIGRLAMKRYIINQQKWIDE